MTKNPKSPLLRVNDLSKAYKIKKGVNKQAAEIGALNGISFDVHEGETVGIVGESGCGKSTLARILTKLEEPTSGTVDYLNRNVLAMGRGETRKLRRDIQMIFQDSSDSLSPRQRITDILDEPLRLHSNKSRRERLSRASELLDLVGLPKSTLRAHPHELSGGQRQRVSVARALSVNPKILVCDEPTSALDVSVQAQVIDLLKSLRSSLGLTYIFISHDLDLVQEFSSKTLVMYLGQIVESANSRSLAASPSHPYTEGLLASTLVPDPSIQRSRRASTIIGEIPSPTSPPTGCKFHPRCPKATSFCTTDEPSRIASSPEESIACHAVNNPERMTGPLINEAEIETSRGGSS